MKKNYLKLNVWLMASLMGIFTFTACSSDDDGKEDDGDKKNIVMENNSTLQGSVKNGQTVTLKEGYNFALNGEYNVEEGGKLIIEPGVTISAKSDDGTIDFILVEQGGKIEAEGTADKPIVMTADNKEAGAWGGVHICGKAPINIGTVGKSEVGDAPYGGVLAGDNSGILRYIRVEYAGYKFTSEKECNGFTFYAVGNGTTIDHLEAYKGSDDGYEWFGGTVNAKYLLSVSNSDDSFDWTEGWCGKGQFFVAYQEDQSTLGYACDCLIEADNYDKNMDATPTSCPTLANLTLIGADQEEGTRGVRLRAGTHVKLYNTLVDGKSKNLTTETEQTESSLVDGTSVLNYVAIAGDVNCSGDGGYSSALFTDAANHNSINNTFSLTNKVVGTAGEGAAMKTIDSWFDDAAYIGAVQNSDTWINESWVKF